MDIDFLKKIESARTIIREKPGSSFFQKRKKPKPPIKEENKKNKIDVRV
jgi:hypothetical protein